MTVADRTTTGARLVRHLRQPMHRSAYALVLGSAVTSVLGYVFWIVAARRFDAAVVGTATSMIAAMGFLANLATLGLRGGLVRFLPTAGAAAGRLIRRSYLLCAGAAALAAGVFIAGQPVWAADLGLLRGSAGAGLAFVAATVCWVIMILQDHVLTGLHRATWVPASGTTYSSVKILLLVALTSASAWSIFAAYVVPAAVVLVCVSVLVLRSAVRAAVATPPGTFPPITGLARFAAADHTAAMLWLATTELLPLLVLARAGASASAYYYLAFTAGYSLFLVTSNVGSALVAEAARAPERLPELATRAARNALALVVPAVAIGIVAAPFVLRLLGPDYAREATDLLRLVLLSAIPQVVVGIGVSVAKVQRRIGRIIAIYAAIAVLVFTGSEVALRTIGLTGVGIAWLLTQTVVAIALLVTQMTFLRSGPAGALVRFASAARRGLRHRRRTRELATVVAAVAARWGRRPTAVRLLTSDNDTLVAAATVDAQDVVIKAAPVGGAGENVRRHATVLQRLLAEPGAAALHHVLPRVLWVDPDGGAAVETRLPGSPAASLDAAPGPDDPVTVQAARLFDLLHRGTAMARPVDEGLRDQLVDAPLRALAALPDVPAAGAMASLRERLRAALTGPVVTVAWTHGDCWLGNVLVTGAGGDREISGVIDWEDARPDRLPDVDLAHLWLTADGAPIGDNLLAALADRGAAFDRWLAVAGIDRPNRHLAPDVVLLLAWLAHVHAGVRRSPPNGPGRVWRRRTVGAVLRRLAPYLEPHPDGGGP